MADDTPPKSSVELAMERLRKKDADAGIVQLMLTDEQKAAIAEIRSFYGSKIAEQEILHQSALRRTFDPAERDAIEAELRRDRERLTEERDAKIAKVRETA
jgi:LPS O-antigen subunit length determinant protein (WzzB/FepE family)